MHQDDYFFITLLGIPFLIFCVLYFLPTLVAWRKGRRLKNIFLLNLLAGWTALGWVAALIWALSDVQKIILVNEKDTPSSPYKGKTIDM